MSEKRFSLKEWEDLNYCEHCFYDGESQLLDSDVVALLNKKQSTIKQLEKDIKDLNFVINFQEKEIDSLKALLKEKECFEEAYCILKKENDNCKNDYRELFSNYVALEEKNEQLRKENEVWQKENKELNSIKKFAEKNGINIFLIDEAFRKCWKDNGKLFEENERLRNQLERKTILFKIRTKHIDDREKSFHELLNYLESFCYKSNIDGNYAKQDIINILNNWEIREYD